MNPLDQKAIDWLLTSDEPGIRLQTRRDLLDEATNATSEDVMSGPIVSRLVSGQRADGGFGVNPYQKWMGAHWRLVSLVELGATASDSRVAAALDHVLDWISADDDPEEALRIRDLYRVHGSIYANALAVATKLGKAADERAGKVAEWLIVWQWPDGGWNCDRHPHVVHSSFYESITPMWALAEYARATGDNTAAEASNRAAEFFLQHSVYKSHQRDHAGDPKWLKLRYPEYWHYDYLHGLVLLDRAIGLSDPRTHDALALLREQQQPDGTWRLDGPQYWKGKTGPYGDAAGWDKTSASQMLTLNALRVLKHSQ
jgi:hypothetical protein